MSHLKRKKKKYDPCLLLKEYTEERGELLLKELYETSRIFFMVAELVRHVGNEKIPI